MTRPSSVLSFAEGPLLRRLVAFALPLMALNMLQYVYQTVDMVVVGQVVGDVGLVAIANAANAAYLVSAFVMGLTTGGGVVIAQAVGAGDMSGQRRAYAATLAVSAAAAGFLALAGVVFARPAFVANAVPAAALEGAVAYTVVMCVGCAGSFLLNAGIAFLKAQGDARLPLVLVGISALVNVVLDLVLVGAAGLGVVGAAYATVAAQGAAGTVAFAVAWRRYPAARLAVRQGDFDESEAEGTGEAVSGWDSDRPLPWRASARTVWRACRGAAACMGAVLRVGVPSAVQMAVVNLSYALVTGLLNRYGTDVAAAAGVGLQISTLAGLPCWAVGQAITTGAAQNVGAGEWARAREVVRLGARFNVGVTMGVQILIQLLAPVVVAAYGLAPGGEAHGLAVLYLRITCSVNGLFYAAMFSFDSFALGAGSPRLVLANSLIDAFAVRFGLAFLLSGVLGCGYVGVFVAQAASPVVPAIVGGLYVRHWSRQRLCAGGRQPARRQRPQVEGCHFEHIGAFAILPSRDGIEGGGRNPMGKTSVLVVEDDADISGIVAEHLGRAGYACTQAFSGTEARLVLEGARERGERFDVVVCDLMLPGLPGEDIVRLVRATDAATPIIVTSARSAASDKIDLLKLGADDHLAKPFDLDELLARIEVQLRHRGRPATPQPGGDALRVGKWTLDRAARTLTVDGTDVPLTRTEFNIVELLAAHPKKVYTKQELFELAWGEPFAADDSTVSVHVSNIRAKLKPTGTEGYIQTVWGLGFKLAADATEE